MLPIAAAARQIENDRPRNGGLPKCNSAGWRLSDDAISL
jgi:hypothetical protein